MTTIYHGSGKTKRFFEGWYLKHQAGGNTLAFIPSISINNEGVHSAYIQVITDHESFTIPFPYSEFTISGTQFALKIGINLFSANGIYVDIQENGLRIRAHIKYGPLTPLGYDIMGPFSILPMDCNHGIISMSHPLEGTAEINGNKIDFANGRGYLEQDWGASFPRRYIWLQCNDFPQQTDSIFLSIAEIPFLNSNFTGCICVVYCSGKEHRLATYLGAQIIRASRKEILIRQGSYLLIIRIHSRAGQKYAQKLLAPSLGQMSRTILEHTSVFASFSFFHGAQLLFEQKSLHAGFEFVDNTSH